MRIDFFVVAISLVGIAGCAAATDAGTELERGNGGTGGGAGSGAAAAAGTSGAGGSGGSGWSGSGGSSGGAGWNGGGGTMSGGSGGSGGAPAGNETLCNGVDDDQNGIIDDVDKGKDGVCDCLRLATIGEKGKWGQGDVFATWLAARSDFGAVPLTSQELTPTLLDQYEVIISQDLSKYSGIVTVAYSQTEATALHAWVQAGGGFMTLTGYADAWSNKNVNALLAPFGMAYGSDPILANSGSTVAVGNWLSHAVTEGVSLIGVGNGYPVTGSGQKLANQNGWDVLQVGTVGKGRVLMWGDEWITYNTEWTTAPQYQVELFWLNIIKWLSPESRCQVPIPPEVK